MARASPGPERDRSMRASVVVADLLNAPVGRSGGEAAAAAARWSGSLDRPCDDQVGLSHAGRCVPSDTTDTFLVTATPPHSPARTAPHNICPPPENYRADIAPAC